MTRPRALGARSASPDEAPAPAVLTYARTPRDVGAATVLNCNNDTSRRQASQ